MDQIQEEMEQVQIPEDNIGMQADAILAGDELIVPPGDPVATANLISMVDPDKVDSDDIETIAEATGSSPAFVEKVVSLVAKSVEDAEETTIEAAQENYSNRVYRLCSRANFSDGAIPIEGKSMEEKLTEVIDIVPTFADQVLENITSEEIADTIAKATGVDTEATTAILNVAKNHADILSDDNDDDDDDEDDKAHGAVADDNGEYVELEPDGDTSIEDEDEYQQPMSDDEIEDKVRNEIQSLNAFTQKNFSYNAGDIVKDVADAWEQAKQGVAIAAHQGAKQAIKTITRSPAYKSLQSWNKVSLQPALVRAEKTIAGNPGIVATAVIAPIGVASLASLISEAVAYKAAADEEEAAGNTDSAERLDDASISTAGKSSIALANSARINMSRQFSAPFANEIYSNNEKLKELEAAKQELANGLYDLGAVFNREQGFWSKLSDFIATYKAQFGAALGATLVFLSPKFVSVNGNRMILGLKEPSFFAKLSNIFNRDPVWIKGIRNLDSFIKENPKTSAASFLMALGTAVWAWAKASNGYTQSPRVNEILAKVKQAEIKIGQLESELGLAVASDIAAVTQPEEMVRMAFSNDANADIEKLYEVADQEDPVATLDNDFGISDNNAEDYFPEEPTPIMDEQIESGLVENLDAKDSEAKIEGNDILTAEQAPVTEQESADTVPMNSEATNATNLGVNSALDAINEEETSEEVQDDIYGNNLVA